MTALASSGLPVPHANLFLPLSFPLLDPNQATESETTRGKRGKKASGEARRRRPRGESSKTALALALALGMARVLRYTKS